MRYVALLGPLGHGKSRILNKICGTNFCSLSGVDSCTRTIEHGKNEQHGLFVIDTPGFGSSDDVAAHIAAQKLTLEGVPLSGVFAVVRYEHRADPICKHVETLMDFLGSDDVRLIVTHADTAPNDAINENFSKLRQSIAKKMDIPASNIAFVAKEASGDEIASFIKATLHEPIEFHISKTQIAAVSSLAGIRRYNRPINRIIAKPKVATDACEKLVARGKTYETDLAILKTQNVSRKAVATEKEKIFRDTYENLESMHDQNLVYGKAGISLSVALQQFVTSTNKLLTWDVTNPRDPRNQYKKCPYCDAFYVKVAGCMNIYKCGDFNHVPEREEVKAEIPMEVDFVEDGDRIWIEYVLDGVVYVAEAFAENLHRYTARTLKAMARNADMAEKLENVQGISILVSLVGPAPSPLGLLFAFSLSKTDNANEDRWVKLFFLVASFGSTGARHSIDLPLAA